MAFINFFFFFLKKFEKVEKTGIISTKFSLRCTLSVILGENPKKFQYSNEVKNGCTNSRVRIVIYFCNMDGFFRILENTSFELTCTRL